MPAAARVGDNHACPHTGGPILPPGSTDVIIDGLPAARTTDKAGCAAGPDVLAMGCPTVVINHQLAVRAGDLTAHGGVVGPGSSNVEIGMVGDGVAVMPFAGPAAAHVKRASTLRGTNSADTKPASAFNDVRFNAGQNADAGQNSGVPSSGRELPADDPKWREVASNTADHIDSDVLPDIDKARGGDADARNRIRASFGWDPSDPDYASNLDRLQNTYRATRDALRDPSTWVGQGDLGHGITDPAARTTLHPGGSADVVVNQDRAIYIIHSVDESPPVQQEAEVLHEYGHVAGYRPTGSEDYQVPPKNRGDITSRAMQDHYSHVVSGHQHWAGPNQGSSSGANS